MISRRASLLSPPRQLRGHDLLQLLPERSRGSYHSVPAHIVQQLLKLSMAVLLGAWLYILDVTVGHVQDLAIR